MLASLILNGPLEKFIKLNIIRKGDCKVTYYYFFMVILEFLGVSW